MNIAYETLAHAIIIQACKDYRSAFMRNDEYTRSEIEVFFKSQWFKVLSPSVDGASYIYLLRKELKEHEVQVKKQPRKSRFFT